MGSMINCTAVSLRLTFHQLIAAVRVAYDLNLFSDVIDRQIITGLSSAFSPSAKLLEMDIRPITTLGDKVLFQVGETDISILGPSLISPRTPDITVGCEHLCLVSVGNRGVSDNETAEMLVRKPFVTLNWKQNNYPEQLLQVVTDVREKLLQRNSRGANSSPQISPSRRGSRGLSHSQIVRKVKSERGPNKLPTTTTNDEKEQTDGSFAPQFFFPQLTKIIYSVTDVHVSVSLPSSSKVILTLSGMSASLETITPKAFVTFTNPAVYICDIAVLHPPTEINFSLYEHASVTVNKLMLTLPPSNIKLLINFATELRGCLAARMIAEKVTWKANVLSILSQRRRQRRDIVTAEGREKLISDYETMMMYLTMGGRCPCKTVNAQSYYNILSRTVGGSAVAIEHRRRIVNSVPGGVKMLTSPKHKIQSIASILSPKSPMKSDVSFDSPLKKKLLSKRPKRLNELSLLTSPLRSPVGTVDKLYSTSSEGHSIQECITLLLSKFQKLSLTIHNLYLDLDQSDGDGKVKKTTSKSHVHISGNEINIVAAADGSFSTLDVGELEIHKFGSCAKLSVSFNKDSGVSLSANTLEYAHQHKNELMQLVSSYTSIIQTKKDFKRFKFYTEMISNPLGGASGFTRHVLNVSNLVFLDSLQSPLILSELLVVKATGMFACIEARSTSMEKPSIILCDTADDPLFIICDTVLVLRRLHIVTSIQNWNEKYVSIIGTGKIHLVDCTVTCCGVIGGPAEQKQPIFPITNSIPNINVDISKLCCFADDNVVFETSNLSGGFIARDSRRKLSYSTLDSTFDTINSGTKTKVLPELRLSMESIIVKQNFEPVGHCKNKTDNQNCITVIASLEEDGDDTTYRVGVNISSTDVHIEEYKKVVKHHKIDDDFSDSSSDKSLSPTSKASSFDVESLEALKLTIPDGLSLNFALFLTPNQDLQDITHTGHRKQQSETTPHHYYLPHILMAPSVVTLNCESGFSFENSYCSTEIKHVNINIPFCQMMTIAEEELDKFNIDFGNITIDLKKKYSPTPTIDPPTSDPDKATLAEICYKRDLEAYVYETSLMSKQVFRDTCRGRVNGKSIRSLVDRYLMTGKASIGSISLSLCFETLSKSCSGSVKDNNIQMFLRKPHFFRGSQQTNTFITKSGPENDVGPLVCSLETPDVEINNFKVMSNSGKIHGVIHSTRSIDFTVRGVRLTATPDLIKEVSGWLPETPPEAPYHSRYIRDIVNSYETGIREVPSPHYTLSSDTVVCCRRDAQELLFQKSAHKDAAQLQSERELFIRNLGLLSRAAWTIYVPETDDHTPRSRAQRLRQKKQVGRRLNITNLEAEVIDLIVLRTSVTIVTSLTKTEATVPSMEVLVAAVDPINNTPVRLAVFKISNPGIQITTSRGDRSSYLSITTIGTPDDNNNTIAIDISNEVVIEKLLSLTHKEIPLPSNPFEHIQQSDNNREVITEIHGINETVNGTVGMVLPGYPPVSTNKDDDLASTEYIIVRQLQTEQNGEEGKVVVLPRCDLIDSDSNFQSRFAARKHVEDKAIFSCKIIGISVSLPTDTKISISSVSSNDNAYTITDLTIDAGDEQIVKLDMMSLHIPKQSCLCDGLGALFTISINDIAIVTTPSSLLAVTTTLTSVQELLLLSGPAQPILWTLPDFSTLSIHQGMSGLYFIVLRRPNTVKQFIPCNKYLQVSISENDLNGYTTVTMRQIRDVEGNARGSIWISDLFFMLNWDEGSEGPLRLEIANRNQMQVEEIAITSELRNDNLMEFTLTAVGERTVSTVLQNEDLLIIRDLQHMARASRICFTIIPANILEGIERGNSFPQGQRDSWSVECNLKTAEEIIEATRITRIRNNAHYQQAEIRTCKCTQPKTLNNPPKQYRRYILHGRCDCTKCQPGKVIEGSRFTQLNTTRISIKELNTTIKAEHGMEIVSLKGNSIDSEFSMRFHGNSFSLRANTLNVMENSCEITLIDKFHYNTNFSVNLFDGLFITNDLFQESCHPTVPQRTQTISIGYLKSSLNTPSINRLLVGLPVVLPAGMRFAPLLAPEVPMRFSPEVVSTYCCFDVKVVMVQCFGFSLKVTDAKLVVFLQPHQQQFQFNIDKETSVIASEKIFSISQIETLFRLDKRTYNRSGVMTERIAKGSIGKIRIDLYESALFDIYNFMRELKGIFSDTVLESDSEESLSDLDFIGTQTRRQTISVVSTEEITAIEDDFDFHPQPVEYLGLSNDVDLLFEGISLSYTPEIKPLTKSKNTPKCVINIDHGFRIQAHRVLQGAHWHEKWKLRTLKIVIPGLVTDIELQLRATRQLAHLEESLIRKEQTSVIQDLEWSNSMVLERVPDDNETLRSCIGFRCVSINEDIIASKDCVNKFCSENKTTGQIVFSLWNDVTVSVNNITVILSPIVSCFDKAKTEISNSPLFKPTKKSEEVPQSQQHVHRSTSIILSLGSFQMSSRNDITSTDKPSLFIRDLYATGTLCSSRKSFTIDHPSIVVSYLPTTPHWTSLSNQLGTTITTGRYNCRDVVFCNKNNNEMILMKWKYGRQRKDVVENNEINEMLSESSSSEDISQNYSNNETPHSSSDRVLITSRSSDFVIEAKEDSISYLGEGLLLINGINVDTRKQIRQYYRLDNDKRNSILGDIRSLFPNCRVPDTIYIPLQLLKYGSENKPDGKTVLKISGIAPTYKADVVTSFSPLLCVLARDVYYTVEEEWNTITGVVHTAQGIYADQASVGSHMASFRRTKSTNSNRMTISNLSGGRDIKYPEMSFYDEPPETSLPLHSHRRLSAIQTISRFDMRELENFTDPDKIWTFYISDDVCLGPPNSSVDATQWIVTTTTQHEIIIVMKGCVSEDDDILPTVELNIDRLKQKIVSDEDPAEYCNIYGAYIHPLVLLRFENLNIRTVYSDIKPWDYFKGSVEFLNCTFSHSHAGESFSISRKHKHIYRGAALGLARVGHTSILDSMPFINLNVSISVPEVQVYMTEKSSDPSKMMFGLAFDDFGLRLRCSQQESRENLERVGARVWIKKIKLTGMTIQNWIDRRIKQLKSINVDAVRRAISSGSIPIQKDEIESNCDLTVGSVVSLSKEINSSTGTLVGMPEILPIGSLLRVLCVDPLMCCPVQGIARSVPLKLSAASLKEMKAKAKYFHRGGSLFEMKSDRPSAPLKVRFISQKPVGTPEEQNLQFGQPKDDYNKNITGVTRLTRMGEALTPEERQECADALGVEVHQLSDACRQFIEIQSPIERLQFGPYLDTLDDHDFRVLATEAGILTHSLPRVDLMVVIREKYETHSRVRSLRHNQRPIMACDTISGKFRYPCGTFPYYWVQETELRQIASYSTRTVGSLVMYVGDSSNGLPHGIQVIVDKVTSDGRIRVKPDFKSLPVIPFRVTITQATGIVAKPSLIDLRALSTLLRGSAVAKPTHPIVKKKVSGKTNGEVAQTSNKTLTRHQRILNGELAIDISHIWFSVLDNSGTSLVEVLRLNCNGIRAKFNWRGKSIQEITKASIFGTFGAMMSMRHFNTYSGAWEPILNNYGIIISMENTRNYLSREGGTEYKQRVSITPFRTSEGTGSSTTMEIAITAHSLRTLRQLVMSGETLTNGYKEKSALLLDKDEYRIINSSGIEVTFVERVEMEWENQPDSPFRVTSDGQTTSSSDTQSLNMIRTCTQIPEKRFVVCSIIIENIVKADTSALLGIVDSTGYPVAVRITDGAILIGDDVVGSSLKTTSERSQLTVALDPTYQTITFSYSDSPSESSRPIRLPTLTSPYYIAAWTTKFGWMFTLPSDLQKAAVFLPGNYGSQHATPIDSLRLPYFDLFPGKVYPTTNLKTKPTTMIPYGRVSLPLESEVWWVWRMLAPNEKSKHADYTKSVFNTLYAMQHVAIGCPGTEPGCKVCSKNKNFETSKVHRKLTPRLKINKQVDGGSFHTVVRSGIRIVNNCEFPIAVEFTVTGHSDKNTKQLSELLKTFEGITHCITIVPGIGDLDETTGARNSTNVIGVALPFSTRGGRMRIRPAASLEDGTYLGHADISKNIQLGDSQHAKSLQKLHWSTRRIPTYVYNKEAKEYQSTSAKCLPQDNQSPLCFHVAYNPIVPYESDHYWLAKTEQKRLDQECEIVVQPLVELINGLPCNVRYTVFNGEAGSGSCGALQPSKSDFIMSSASDEELRLQIVMESDQGGRLHQTEALIIHPSANDTPEVRKSFSIDRTDAIHLHTKQSSVHHTTSTILRIEVENLISSSPTSRSLRTIRIWASFWILNQTPYRLFLKAGKPLKNLAGISPEGLPSGEIEPILYSHDEQSDGNVVKFTIKAENSNWSEPMPGTIGVHQVTCEDITNLRRRVIPLSATLMIGKGGSVSSRIMLIRERYVCINRYKKGIGLRMSGVTIKDAITRVGAYAKGRKTPSSAIQWLFNNETVKGRKRSEAFDGLSKHPHIQLCIIDENIVWSFPFQISDVGTVHVKVNNVALAVAFTMQDSTILVEVQKAESPPIRIINNTFHEITVQQAARIPDKKANKRRNAFLEIVGKSTHPTYKLPPLTTLDFYYDDHRTLIKGKVSSQRLELVTEDATVILEPGKLPTQNGEPGFWSAGGHESSRKKKGISSHFYCKLGRRSINVNVEPKTKAGQIFIKPIRARGLIASDYHFGRDRSSDPYCEVTLGTVVGRTKHILNSLDPEWGDQWLEPFDFHTIREDLIISIYDFDLLSENDFLGQVVIDPGTLPPSGTRTFPLTYRDRSDLKLVVERDLRKDGRPDFGEVTIEWKQEFNDTFNLAIRSPTRNSNSDDIRDEEDEKDILDIGVEVEVQMGRQWENGVISGSDSILLNNGTEVDRAITCRRYIAEPPPVGARFVLETDVILNDVIIASAGQTGSVLSGMSQTGKIRTHFDYRNDYLDNPVYVIPRKLRITAAVADNWKTQLSIILSVSLSLCGMESGHRKELMCITLEQFGAEFLVSKRGRMSFEVSVDDIQIDNTLGNAKYPVVFSLHNDVESGYGLQIVGTNFTKTNAGIIGGYLGAMLLPCEFTVTDVYLQTLYASLLPFLKLHSQTDAAVIQEICRLQTDYARAEDDDPFVYIREMEITQTAVSLGFRSLGVQKNGQALRWLSALGMRLAQIEGAVFQFQQFPKESPLYCHVRELNSMLTKHYIMDGLLANLVATVSASQVLGNPGRALYLIKEGTADLVRQPMRGALLGPRGFFKGVGLGGASFLYGLAGGTLSFLGRVTGNLAGVIDVIGIDKKTEREERNRRMQKDPITFRVGLKDGAKLFTSSVVSAVTGLAQRPVDGYHRDGWIGAAKGTGKGLVGIIIKPIQGAFQFFTKAVGGAANNLAEGREKARERKRNPRVFVDGNILPHDESSRNRVFALLCKLDPSRYHSEAYEYHINGLPPIEHVLTTSYISSISEAVVVFSLKYSDVKFIVAPNRATSLRIHHSIQFPNFISDNTTVSFATHENCSKFLVMLKRFHPSISVYTNMNKMILRMMESSDLIEIDATLNTTFLTEAEDIKAVAAMRHFGGPFADDDDIDEDWELEPDINEKVYSSEAPPMVGEKRIADPVVTSNDATIAIRSMKQSAACCECCAIL